MPQTMTSADDVAGRSSVAAMNAHVKRATYTYSIARPFHPSHLWGVRGVDRTPVHLVHHGELVAVVGTLSFTEADEAALRARLETPAELEAIARAHHAVVTAVFEHSVTLPFRLATIHRSEQRVVEMLRTGHERFRSALARLDGRVEVGVKIYSDVVASSPASAGSGDGANSDGSADAGRHFCAGASNWTIETTHAAASPPPQPESATRSLGCPSTTGTTVRRTLACSA